ncbi:asparagine synthase (glutamine-hydrolyzing) [Geobacter hydrogenophilus]|uniref:asparagine synthase (glutamine-hydrolyzing) n=1 Tax=Geobacter hydrogenophilus TaxID=40983 RepID=A0A9W6LAN0_9BACT|nr:asparagine synthase (glutamine-hydrolyzing) [Geobacter hydrogenophilus]MBT0894785.1 asparagine synthase (glutamine-hydrolyzing) [Geobacter hydrogenophilus]GLI37377.1 amidotransferase 1, exosortase A system-associated [Geobacter hydrogenophilus]
MCGIAGCIAFDGADAHEVVARMVPQLAHRGPDGEGVWSEGTIAIGHRRLSIIDLETGKQPMSNEDGSVTITYNGELYNFMELRHELLRKGHAFRTSSDTEVIIHAYEEWGDACVERFRGMFSFGIVDTRNRRLFLARDHLGIKPLVYYSTRGRFAFASEIQALKAAADKPLEIDLQSIDQYLLLQYIPAPGSAYRQVRKLLPGHRMSVSFDGIIQEPEGYWRFAFSPVAGKTEEEWVEEVDAALRESVRAHLVSDVPFGAFLSGGVDSSAVVAYMAQLLDTPVETFSIGFEEAEFSELPFAEAVAKRWRTNHHVEIVKPDALAILPDLVRHYGEPFGDSSAVPTYYVCRMARRHVTMVLSGDGGDELFAGYQSHLEWIAYLTGTEPSKSLWRRAVYPVATRLFPERYPPRYPYGPTLRNWLRFNTYFSAPLRQRLWRGEHHRELTQLDRFEKAFEKGRDFSPVNKAQYWDIKTYLPFDILTKVDVASMMNSLEVRTPIIDVKVAEFAAQIPETFNIRQVDGVWAGKLLLKKLMEKYYPPEFLHRRKMGFSVPLAKWFTTGESSLAQVADRLLARNSEISEFFEPATVRRLVRFNRSEALWRLLFLEEWLSQNR